jgi:putative membrane protein
MTTMHGYGWIGPMGGMMVSWLLLTMLAVGLVVWLAVSYARPRRGEDTDAARRSPAERYARGELDTDEYTQRVAALR